jgi:hypothetical protein
LGLKEEEVRAAADERDRTFGDSLRLRRELERVTEVDGMRSAMITELERAVEIARTQLQSAEHSASHRAEVADRLSQQVLRPTWKSRAQHDAHAVGPGCTLRTG